MLSLVKNVVILIYANKGLFYFHICSPMPYNKILLNVNLLSNILCLYTTIAIDLQSYTQHIKSELLDSTLSYIVITSPAIVL